MELISPLRQGEYKCDYLQNTTVEENARNSNGFSRFVLMISIFIFSLLISLSVF